MLEQLRRNSRSFIIWILFAIIILAFVFTFGSQGGLQFDGGAGGGATFIMKVDGTEIPVDSYRFGRSSLRVDGNESDRMQFVLDKLLEREILASAARKSGFSIAKETVISEYLGKGKFITMGYPQDFLDTPDQADSTGFMKPGYDNSVDPPARVWLIDETRLEAYVNQMGLASIDGFIREQQREILADMMRSTLRASVTVAQDEARAEFEYENTTATINAVVYKPVEYSSRLILTDEDAARYVSEHHEELMSEYDAEKERSYTGRKPQKRVRQMFFKRPAPAPAPEPEPEPDEPAADEPAADKPADQPAAGESGPEKPAAGSGDASDADESATGDAEPPAASDAGRLAADKAHARLQAGEDFAAVAKEVSEDDMTRPVGGDLGWKLVEFPGLGDSRLVEAVKSLEKGAYSEVIDTPRGYYILYIEDQREGDLSFDQVKLELARKKMKPEYASALARADAEATLAKLKAGGKMDEMFEKGFQPGGFRPDALPPEFWQQLSPEQRRKLLEGMNPQGSLTFESPAFPAQSGQAAPVRADKEPEPEDPPAGGVEAGAGGEAQPSPPSDLPIARPADVPAPKLQNIGPFQRSADGNITSIGDSKELVNAIFDELQAGQLAPKVYEVDGSFVVVEVVDRANPDPSKFDDKTRADLMRTLADIRGYKLVNNWVLSQCRALSQKGKVELNNSAINQLLGDDKDKFKYQVCQRLDM